MKFNLSIFNFKTSQQRSRSIIAKIIKSLLFLIILFSLNYALTRVYYSFMSHLNVIKSEKKFFQNDFNKTEILVLGDSHAMYLWKHYTSFRLDNWATEGERFIQNYYKLKWFLDKYHPRAIIIPVDLHTFSSKALFFGHDFFWVKYVDYLELAFITHQYDFFISKYIRGLFFPYAGQQGVIQQWISRKANDANSPQNIAGASLFNLLSLSNQNENTSSAFKKERLSTPPPSRPGVPFHLLSPQERQALAQYRAGIMIDSKNYMNKFVMQYFRKMLSMCKKKGVTVFLVKFPVSKELYTCAAREIPVGKYYKKIAKIIQKFPNTYILDYQGIFFQRPQLLYDSDHPNLHEGALILNQKLNADIKRIFNKIKK